MANGADHHGELAGFSVPVHRSLTEHILLGGAPRSIAILNGTLAAALGLGLREHAAASAGVAEGGVVTLHLIGIRVGIGHQRLGKLAVVRILADAADDDGNAKCAQRGLLG